jgi:serine/threonine protein kinase
MYQLGYIHRDLSCGNILLVDGEKGPTGVLIDFEYANKFPKSDIAPHDHRTVGECLRHLLPYNSRHLLQGTREFMANEVHVERFRYAIGLGNQYKPRWFHHPIHDVESIRWIALWTFYFLQESPAEQRHALFPHSGTGSRSDIWAWDAEYENLCSHPSKPIMQLLFKWLQAIQAEHKSLQAGFDMNRSYESFDYHKACEVSIGFLQRIRLALQGIRGQEEPNEGDKGEGIAEAEDVDRPRKRMKTEGINNT